MTASASASTGRRLAPVSPQSSASASPLGQLLRWPPVWRGRAAGPPPPPLGWVETPGGCTRWGCWGGRPRGGSRRWFWGDRLVARAGAPPPVRRNAGEGGRGGPVFGEGDRRTRDGLRFRGGHPL